MNFIMGYTPQKEQEFSYSSLEQKEQRAVIKSELPCVAANIT